MNISICFIIIGFLILIILLVYLYNRNTQIRKNEKEVINKHKQELRKKMADQKSQNKKNFYNILDKDYGLPTATYDFYNENGNFTAYLFESKSLILISKDYKIKDVIPFSSILDFSVDRKEIQNNGYSQTVTKTSTGSMLGRGLAGGLIFGGIGVVVGAVTAKRESETLTHNKDIIYEYTININLNSFDKPIYQMEFGRDYELCSKVAGYLTIIMRKESHVENAKLEITSHKNEKNYDTLFKEIALFIVQSNTASVASLQRRFSIGLNRASKIMDQLESVGIVGPSLGGKPRSVLMDPMELDLYFAENNFQ